MRLAVTQIDLSMLRYLRFVSDSEINHILRLKTMLDVRSQGNLDSRIHGATPTPDRCGTLLTDAPQKPQVMRRNLATESQLPKT